MSIFDNRLLWVWFAPNQASMMPVMVSEKHIVPVWYQTDFIQWKGVTEKYHMFLN